MARIIIYDATELDKKQLTEALAPSDHNWHFVEEKLSMDNIDPEAEVIAVFVTSVTTREMIDAMPKLKLISCRSTGFNTVDVAYAQEKGITVTNVPTYGESTVAEYAFTLLLALMRKLPIALTDAHNVDQATLRGSDLTGKTYGVIGSGHIGQKSISIGKGFGMRVVAYDPFPNEDVAKQFGFEYVSFDELVATADIVSLHAPYNEQTHHIINSEAIDKMKQNVVIVNTARGELIDTKALLIALKENKIAGAALDVVEGESLANQDEEIAMLRDHQVSKVNLIHSVEISALSKMPNVIVTPHNAFNTTEAVGRINSTAAQNIIDFWYGKTPNAVSPGKKSMGKLIMVRHAESEWNASGQWTGTRDVHLSENGFRQAAVIGHEMDAMSIKVDVSICSEQVRTLETLEAILNAIGQLDTPVLRSGAINERDYGDYTGMNKWQVKDEVGEEQWNAIRRGWDVHVPNGESLKAVYERVVPYYQSSIIPLLQQGKNVLLVAHGNSLRALIKYIESIPDEAVAELEMLFGDVVTCMVDDEGHLISKDVKRVDFSEIEESYADNLEELSRNIGS